MAKKGYHHLRYDDRLLLEKLLRKKFKTGEIAKALKCSKQTVRNEKKRGAYIHRNSDYTEEVRYSAELAEEKYQLALQNRGTSLKIGNDHEYARYLEKKMLEEDYSPAAVLGELKVTGHENEFKTKICVRTLYSYIKKGVFLHITYKDLPVAGKRKRKHGRVHRQKRASAGTCIIERDPSVETREEFGHWEMDCVIGNKKSKNVLLVLTERKTREELLFKMNSKEAKNVVEVLNQLEREYGKYFPQVFKTITVDNGTEFSDFEGMQASSLQEGQQRTKLYYCHAYCSSERGSNENQNKMVRRKIPKGTNFDDKTDEEIKAIETWMNTYPRKILEWHCSHDLFSQEIALIM